MSDKSVRYIKIQRALDEKDGFLGKQLQLAALFLLCFENIKDRLLDRIKTFFSRGAADGKYQYSKEYYERFTGQKPYDQPLVESLKFLTETGVIKKEDADTFKTLKAKRDEIGHKLTGIVFDDSKEIISGADLDALLLFSFKLDNGWIREFESSIAPENYAQFSPEDMAQACSAMTELLLIVAERTKAANKGV